MTALRYGGEEGLLWIKLRVQSEHDPELGHVRRGARGEGRFRRVKVTYNG